MLPRSFASYLVCFPLSPPPRPGAPRACASGAPAPPACRRSPGASWLGRGGRGLRPPPLCRLLSPRSLGVFRRAGVAKRTARASSRYRWPWRGREGGFLSCLVLCLKFICEPRGGGWSGIGWKQDDGLSPSLSSHSRRVYNSLLCPPPSMPGSKSEEDKDRRVIVVLVCVDRGWLCWRVR